MDANRDPRPRPISVERSDRVYVPRIEAYETGPETVIFDGENPLAWIASSAAVPIEQQA